MDGEKFRVRNVLLITSLVLVVGVGMGISTSTAQAQADGSFEITSFDAPSEATAGERIEVEATVRNTGDASGSTPIEYRVDDVIVMTKRVTLEGGTSEEVEFDVVVPDISPGTYDHGAFIDDTNRGETAELEILEPEEPEPEDGEADGEADGEDGDGGEGGDGEGMPGFTFAAGIIALISLALLSRYRRSD